MKYKIVTITPTTPIPAFFLTWGEGATKAFLRNEGFDMTREIERLDNPVHPLEVTFRQEEK